jgi:hypothetical protein
MAALGTTALDLLISDTTPQEVRDQVEALLVDGQKVTVADIRRMKAEARNAQEALAGLEQAKAGRERAVALAQDEISERDDRPNVAAPPRQKYGHPRFIGCSYSLLQGDGAKEG